jgi:hypothetical protein
MRTPRVVPFTLLLSLLMFGCARPATPVFDPVGDYTFQTEVQGQTIGGQLSIRGTPGNYTGTMRPGGDVPPITFSRVTVEGTTVTANGEAMGAFVTFVLNFTGDQFTGSWDAGDATGYLNGRRVPR